MADAPLVLLNDELPEGVGKINQGIDNANQALRKSYKAEVNSHTAIENAINASSKADNAVSGVVNVQKQIDELVVSGDSSVEAAQARVDTDGNSASSLKERLDNDYIFLLESKPSGDLIFKNSTKGPLYSAHSGVSRIAPENTIPAFELAGKLGYKLTEADVRVTADGKFVILHDETLERMTGSLGKVQNMTLAEIKSLNVIGGNRINEYMGTKIPTLEEFLQVCSKWNMIPIIELKQINNDSDINSFVSALEQTGFLQNCAVISFSRYYLEKIREVSNKIYVGLILGTITNDDLAFTKRLKNSFIHVEYTAATSSNIKLAHAQGLKITTWTVNELNKVDKLVEDGIDSITTDILL
ncbi:glycerophosphodiester phosphodiesterase family protein [Bacillus sp. FSL L8-0199]|uniref:glycerophosphodiester phosphodiesterase n=1 Tax=Bacillus sp. FSL L8-0199 TaxID=2954616 RepID=UPI0030F88940